MIKINLLGDALAQAGGKKGERADQPVQVYTEGEGAGRAGFPLAGVAVGLVGVVAALVYFLWLNSEVARASALNARLTAEKLQYDPYIKLEKEFSDKKAALAKKEEVILGLKTKQQLPVHFMEELANSLPDDVWFKKVSQKGMQITVEGEARNFEAINQFYTNLQGRTRWFKKINYPGGTKKDNIVTFTISFELQNAV